MIQLKRIKVKNFKCFSDEVDLELGKLTLFTGANSTGKSSLMYSVLGALQSAHFPFEYSANGRYVNMGNFAEMVYAHNKSLPIELSFSLVEDGVEIDISTVWINSNVNDQAVLSEYKANSNSFEFSVKQKEKDNNTDYLLSLDYQPDKNLSRKDLGLDRFLADIYRIAELYKAGHQGQDISDELKAGFDQRTMVKDVALIINETGIRSPDNVQAMIAFGIVNSMIMNAIKRYKQKMNFISSYRLAAERIYLEEGLDNGKIQSSGKGFVNQVLQWRESNRHNYESLIGVMRSIGMFHDIEPKRIGGGQFSVDVTIHKDGPKASLSDVGFGISQLLPIVVGDIELGDESTLFAAQPEIHLHPNAQANYGDYIVGQINNNKNYIIETHSEYFLNRIRLAIVKGQLKEEDIRVYYLSQALDASKLYPVRFTKSGQILDAPEDFFETYMIDVMNIAMEAVSDEA